MTDTHPSGATAELDDSVLDAMVDVPAPMDGGRPYACLSEYGMPIWVLVNRMGEPTRENIARVAWEYHIPEVGVRAALRYYERNKKDVDAVIVLNNESFGLNE